MVFTDGQMIGNRYRILSQIGAGGMGAVYRALDRLTGETVALKQMLLQAESADGMATTGREDIRLILSREFGIVAGLRHPHIISVLDYGFDQQRQPYFTMTLLDKPQTVMQAAQAKSLPEKVHLLLDILAALSYLHRRGIIHRDLKPANVLVSGGVKVLDFGLATPTRTTDGQPSSEGGTLAYMAPELFQRGSASIASDLYAVGVIAYEMLKGRCPFENADAGLLVRQIVNDSPDYSGLEDEVEAVLERLLAKSPADRYADADAVIGGLCRAVNEPVPPESQTVRESFLQASRFVGRKSEMEQLSAALEAIFASGKSAQVYLIGGESGVGKSRLIDELRTLALVKGALVLRGQGVAQGGLSDQQLWGGIARQLILTTALTALEASIIKAIVPDIGLLLGQNVLDAPLLNGAAGQQRLVLTLVDMLKRQTQPLVLLLEDLQWADESLEPIRQILAVRDQLPHLLVLGTYRDDERPHLPDTFPGTQTLKLLRLTDEAIADLTESMLGTVGKQPQVIDLLKRETEGNIFFIVETVRALAEEAGRLSNIGRKTLPQHVFAGGMQQVIRRRLSRAPEWTQPMLKLAAVIGRELDTSVLNTVATQNHLEAFLNACADAAVLEIAEGRWRFAHDKLREMVVTDITPAERVTLNRQAAQAIETAYPGDNSRAAVLVDHWGAGDDKAKEAHYAAVASDQHMKVSRFSQALGLAERGLTALKAATEATAPSDTIELLNLVGQAQIGLSDYAAAVEHHRAALELSRQVRETSGEITALHGLGKAAEQTGDYAAADGYIRDSLTLARTLNDRPRIAISLSHLGILATYQADYPTARTYFEESLSMRREIGDLQHVGNSLNSLGIVAYYQGDLAASRAYYAESLTIYEKINDRQGLATGLGNLGIVALAQGDFTTARDCYEKSLVIFREVGELQGIALSLMNLGEVALATANYTPAQTYLEDALVIFREINFQQGIAGSLADLGNIALKQGNYPSARTHFEESLAICEETGERRGVAAVKLKLGFTHVALTEPAKAQQHFQDSIQAADEMGALNIVAEGVLGFARLYLLNGQPVRSAELAACITHHPATDAELHSTELPAIQRELEAALPASELVAAMERGKALDLETIVKQVLAETTAESNPPH